MADHSLPPIEKSLEQALLDAKQERDRAWEKVKPATSTRWQLTAFEKADDRYRLLCRMLEVEYVEVTH